MLPPALAMDGRWEVFFLCLLWTLVGSPNIKIEIALVAKIFVFLLELGSKFLQIPT